MNLDFVYTRPTPPGWSSGPVPRSPRPQRRPGCSVCGGCWCSAASGVRGTARAVADSLGPLCAGLHTGARMHVPAEVADRGVEAARAAGADGCVAVGGGSAIGLGKAVALRTGLP